MRVSLLVLAVALSSPAWAQEAQEVQEEQPTSPPPVVVAQPVVVVPVDAPVRKESREERARLRWGIDGAIGFHSPYGAFGLGLEGHIGTQLTNFLGAYLAIGGHLGVGVGYGVAGLGAQVSGTAIAHFTMAALIEAIIANHFWLAAGPAFGLGGMALGGLGIATTGGTITGVSAGGFKPGFDVRAGWGFHSPNPRTGRRKGFNLGVDVLVLFHPNGTVTEVATDFQGSQVTVERTRTLTTVTPMITLGYESR